MENVKIKINIKTFLNYEKLTKKSFTNVDYSNEEDLTLLLYSCFIANNNYKFTLESFISFLGNNKSFADTITNSFKEEVEFSKQFLTESTEESTSSTEDYYIKDVIPILVMNCNLDINYVLYELELTDIHTFMEAYNNQVQQKMELDRLWCYFGMLPHVDGKKLKSPKDLFKFSWEDEKVSLMSVDELDEVLKNNKLN